MTQNVERAPYSDRDLARVLGWGRDKVRRCMRDGTLPGYVDGRTYSVPAEAFERFCRGEWVSPVRLPVAPIVRQEDAA